jgi:hypothetical protein
VAPSPVSTKFEEAAPLKYLRRWLRFTWVPQHTNPSPITFLFYILSHPSDLYPCPRYSALSRALILLAFLHLLLIDPIHGGVVLCGSSVRERAAARRGLNGGVELRLCSGPAAARRARLLFVAGELRRRRACVLNRSASHSNPTSLSMAVIHTKIPYYLFAASEGSRTGSRRVPEKWHRRQTDAGAVALMDSSWRGRRGRGSSARGRGCTVARRSSGDLEELLPAIFSKKKTLFCGGVG